MFHKKCHLVVSEQGHASETQIASWTKLTSTTLEEILTIFQFVLETEIETRHDLRPEFHLRTDFPDPLPRGAQSAALFLFSKYD